MVNPYVPILQGLDARGSRKLITHVLHTNTGQLRTIILAAWGPSVNKFSTLAGAGISWEGLEYF